MNDYQFKVVRLQGDFIWHDHKNTDETFIVLDGLLRIDFRAAPPSTLRSSRRFTSSAFSGFTQGLPVGG